MSELHPMYKVLKQRQEQLLGTQNEKTDFYNGIYDRWKNPVLTREHIPVEWCYDLNPKTNPFFEERLGVNVVFTNGAIARDNGEVYIYYAASDTRLHVATTTVEKLLDYAFNTPADPLRSRDCVAQRCQLIDRNLEYLK